MFVTSFFHYHIVFKIHPCCSILSVQFSRSVVSNSLWPHEPQHARLPCPSPTPKVHPNPCLLSRWCHPTISSSVVPFSSCPQSFPASGSLQNESALCIRYPKYWSFSFPLAISCLTTSNVPWFMDLTFQVPMQYGSLQHRTLLLSPVPFTTGCCFSFGSIPSFFQYFTPFYSPVILHCMSIPHFIYPFIHDLLDSWVISTFWLL